MWSLPTSSLCGLSSPCGESGFPTGVIRTARSLGLPYTYAAQNRFSRPLGPAPCRRPVRLVVAFVGDEAVELRTLPGKWPYGCGVRSKVRLFVAGNAPVGAVECAGLSGLDRPVTARRSVRRADYWKLAARSGLVVALVAATAPLTD
jgi:hypothetical protein